MLPYDERGFGEAVVLLHAGVADRTMWLEHLEPLADAGFRALAVDLPGFGEALPSAGRQAPWEDVLATLRELDIARAALVGNSFGAAVALRVAVVAPSAVARLMLISPPPLKLDPSPMLSAAWEAEETALEGGDIDAAVRAVLDAWVSPQAPEAVRARVAAMQRRAFELQDELEGVEEAPDPLDEQPELLARITAPVLAACGEADMPDFRAGAQEIAALVPDGRATTIEGAGHLAPLEAPEQFERLLLGFLRDGS